MSAVWDEGRTFWFVYVGKIWVDCALRLCSYLNCLSKIAELCPWTLKVRYHGIPLFILIFFYILKIIYFSWHRFLATPFQKMFTKRKINIYIYIFFFSLRGHLNVWKLLFCEAVLKEEKRKNEFSGGPVVKALNFYCHGCKFHPWSEN